MTTPRLTVAEFKDALDRLGETLADWPDELRTAAAFLLNSSDEAARLLSDAQAVRAALKPAAVKAPAGLADRILAKALGQTDKT